MQNLYLLRLGFDVQFIGLLVGLGQVVWAAAALPAGMLSTIRLRIILLPPVVQRSVFGMKATRIVALGNIQPGT